MAARAPLALPARPALRRLPDWQSRLCAYLAAHARAPFDPALWHCATFADGAIAAMCGASLAGALGIRARSIGGGIAALRRRGLADHTAAAAWAFEAVPPAFAAPGDIAFVPSEAAGGRAAADAGRALAAGIVQGAGVYVLTPAGIGLVPRLDPAAGARLAFRVP